MRLAVGIALGLIGAWLLWKAVKLARVLLVVDYMQGETYLIVAAVVMTALAAGLFFASWRLVRPRRP